MSELPPEQPPAYPPPPGAPPPPPSEVPYWTPAQPPPGRSRRSLMVILAIVAAFVIVLVAVGAYALAGRSVSSNRIDATDSALSNAISHQSDFEQSMSQIGQSFSGVSGSNFSPTQYKATIDQFVQSSQRDQSMVADDRSKLDSAASRLHDSEWLTLLYKSDIDRESARVQHADKALDAAKTVADDFVKDGAFFEALAATIIDFDDVANRAQAKDFAGASAAVAKMKNDATKALGLADAPGMPQEVQQFMVDLQDLATDFDNLFNAAASGNSGAVATAKAKGDADVSALQSIDMSSVESKIDAFYQPYETTYRQEMQLAAG